MIKHYKKDPRTSAQIEADEVIRQRAEKSRHIHMSFDELKELTEKLGIEVREEPDAGPADMKLFFYFEGHKFSIACAKKAVDDLKKFFPDVDTSQSYSFTGVSIKEELGRYLANHDRWEEFLDKLGWDFLEELAAKFPEVNKQAAKPFRNKGEGQSTKEL